MMRKNIHKILITTVVFTGILFAVLYGCTASDDVGDILYTTPEYVYSIKNVLRLDEIDYMRHLTYSVSSRKCYTSAYVSERIYYSGDSFYTKENAAIYTIDVDNGVLTKLINYTMPIEVPANASGMFEISSMCTDDEGNIWVVERYDYTIFDIPEYFNNDNESLWDYVVSDMFGTIIRKLDALGTELQRINLRAVIGYTNNIFINAINIDNSGNIYFVVNDFNIGKNKLFVLEDNGEIAFELKLDSDVNTLFRLKTGEIAFTDSNFGRANEYALQTISFKAKTFGDDIKLPSIGWQIYKGGGSNFEFIINDSNNLFGIDIGDEEPVRLLNWLDSDISSSNIQDTIAISDEKIICITEFWDNVASQYKSEIIFLEKTPYSELPEKIIITLATIDSNLLRDFVAKFNRENPEYRIQLTDYSIYNTQDNSTAGITRLSTEIVSGIIPDIIDTSNLPYNEYVRIGLLTDLYPFLDTDTELNRDDFIQAPLKAAEIDGKLYQIFRSFTIYTILGHPSIAGEGTGWTLEEFRDVLDMYPEADKPFGNWLNNMNFLQSAVAFRIDEFINWETGVVNFDSYEFINLLEYSNMLPNNSDVIGTGNNLEGVFFSASTVENIATGRQIMERAGIYDLWFYSYYKALFGGEIVFKGIPTDNRNGNSFGINNGLAITENSTYKEGAWSFIRTMLTEEAGGNEIIGRRGIPVNQKAFDAITEIELNNVAPRTIFGIKCDALTQKDINELVMLINSIDNIIEWSGDPMVRDIISETANDYFRGHCSVHEAANIIQRRVSILVSERN